MRDGLGREVGDDLVAVEVEIDPMLGAPAFRAAEQLAVKAARGREVVDREGEMEGRQASCRALPAQRIAVQASVNARYGSQYDDVPLLALIAGAVSAFAFEPAGWWPLMPLAFALLCELLDRARRRCGGRC